MPTAIIISIEHNINCAPKWLSKDAEIRLVISSKWLGILTPLNLDSIAEGQNSFPKYLLYVKNFVFGSCEDHFNVFCVDPPLAYIK